MASDLGHPRVTDSGGTGSSVAEGRGVPSAPNVEPPIEIGPMRRRHLNGVMAIESKALHTPWSLGIFLRELSHRDTRTYLVARQAGAVVGFAGTMYVAGEAHITNVSVAKSHRRRGIGGLLLHSLMEASLRAGMTSASLEVRSGNTEAQAMYSRFGFAPAGVRKGYYPQTNEDALVMWVHDLDQPEFTSRLRRLGEAFHVRVYGSQPPQDGAHS